MTRKHFIAIAAAIKTRIDSAAGFSNEFERQAATAVVVLLAKDIARIAASDNLNFDAARFLAACGIN